MDFVVGFSLTSLRHNAILVIVDKLTKSSHFILVRDTYDVTNVERVFVSEVICLHGIPKKIISDAGASPTSSEGHGSNQIAGQVLALILKFP